MVIVGCHGNQAKEQVLVSVTPLVLFLLTSPTECVVQLGYSVMSTAKKRKKRNSCNSCFFSCKCLDTNTCCLTAPTQLPCLALANKRPLGLRSSCAHSVTGTVPCSLHEGNHCILILHGTNADKVVLRIRLSVAYVYAMHQSVIHSASQLAELSLHL